MAPKDGGVLANLRRYIKDEHHAAQKEAPWDDDGWTHHVWVAGKHNTPRQTNTWDCGVFMCQTADLYAQDARLDFGQDDVEYLRRRMAIDIHNEKLFAQGEPGAEEPQPRAPQWACATCGSTRSARRRRATTRTLSAACSRAE